MIESSIGKIFLEAYNERYGTDYDARRFFIEVFYPMFFDQQKYMMTAGNSPLENPKLSWEDMILGKKPFETPEQRNERYEKLMSKIDEIEADASVARGYYSLDANATTSGQVTDLRLPISKEDVFASWIGDALGVGVQGGLSILFNDKSILLDIYEGWKLYRTALNNTNMLKGNQINTWNGQWLSHYYDSRVYSPDAPMAGFARFVTSSSGLLNIETISWTKVLIGLSRKYTSIQVLGYVYSIGQTNTTIGFIPFNLDQIRKPGMLYRKYFGMDNGRTAESLWGTEYGFRASCCNGVIGIRAMEPKGLKPYIEKGNVPKKPKEEQIINYNVYKIWILAMLNNESLWELSLKLAELLNVNSRDSEKSISTRRKNLVESVLEACNKKQFVSAITELAPYVEDKGTLRSIVREIHEMPNDNVPYFLTLMKFQYVTMQ